MKSKSKNKEPANQLLLQSIPSSVDAVTWASICLHGPLLACLHPAVAGLGLGPPPCIVRSFLVSGLSLFQFIIVANYLLTTRAWL